MACVQSAVPLIYWSLDAYNGDIPDNTLLNGARIVASGLFLWIAGTLPLQTVEASTDIAGAKDVGWLLRCRVVFLNDTRQIPSVTLSMPEDKVTVRLLVTILTRTSLIFESSCGSGRRSPS